MGVECAVATCHIKRTRETKVSGITFHLFPKDADVREKWRSKMRRRDDWVPKDWDVVCSVHFKHGDFDCTGQTVRLQRGAVPSVFPRHSKPLPTMPRHCSVGGCRSRDNRQSREAGVTFHRLPKGASRRRLWITNSLRHHSWDPQTDFVYFCSKHFTPQSFEVTGCSGVRRLREDAVPTLFDQLSEAKRKSAPRRDKGGVRTPRSPPLQTTDEAAAGPEDDSPSPLTSAHLSDRAASLPEPRPRSPEPHPHSPEPRPDSPSRYMRRLPPPAGFYLPKEHSYALLCPRMWRKRYDQVVDCLENALRQLHAARRRETRLRNTVLRLRDKQLKHLKLTSPHGLKDKVLLSREGTELQDTQRPGLFQEDCGAPFGVGGVQGHCPHCRKGQADVSQPDEPLSERPEAVHAQTHGAPQVQLIRLRPPPESDTAVTETDAQLHSTGLQPAAPAPSASEGLEPLQLLYLGEGLSGHLVLLQHQQQSEGLHRPSDQLQAVLCSEDHESSSCESKQEAMGHSNHGNLQADITGAPVDMRERLKEHLEGFHLQLSSEFIA